MEAFNKINNLCNIGKMIEIENSMEQNKEQETGRVDTVVMWRCVEKELPDTDKMVLTCTLTGKVSVGRYRQVNSQPRDHKLQEWRTQLERSTNEVYWWAEYSVPNEAT